MHKDEVERKSIDEISSSLMQMLQGLYTATKTVHMYPPDNPSVVRMVDNAFEAVVEMIPVDGSLDLSFMEAKLVVNGEMLDEAFQKRGITGSIHELMKARRISSITFWSGLNRDELKKFLKVLGTKAPSVASDEKDDIYEILEEEEITHVEVDEQIYVAISKREKVVDARVAVEREEDAALKTLKDEVFARFLAGEASIADISDDEIKGMVSDPDKILSMVQGVISSSGWDSEVESLPFRIDETRTILERVSSLIEKVDDPLVRSKLSREVSKITAQVDTPQLTDMILRSPETGEAAELPRVLLPLIGDKKLTGVVESVVEEYKDLTGRETGNDWPSPRLSAIKSVLENAASSAEGKLAERITGIIDEAGIETKKPEDEARLTGGELAKKLMAGEDAGMMDKASGPALVGAAHYLFESGEDELGARVMENLADKFRKQSSETRIVAANQIWRLFKDMRNLGKEAYTVDLIDDVTRTIDEHEDTVMAFRGISESLEGITGGDGVGPGLEPGISASGKTVERLMKSDTGKVVKAAFISGDKEAREAITRALMEMDDRAVPALVDTALDATDDETLASLAVSLGQLDADPIPNIASRLSSDIEEHQLVNLVKIVGMVGEENSVSILNPLLLSESLEVHMAVIGALGSLGGKQALQMVLSESVSVDPQLRVEAIRELGNFRDYQAVRRLMEVITPPKKGETLESSQVLIAACRSLEKLHVQQAVDTLVQISSGGKKRQEYTEEVRASATAALGTIGGEAAQKALRKLIKDDSMLIRSTARKALSR